jgi:hypothetical protein
MLTEFLMVIPQTPSLVAPLSLSSSSSDSLTGK